MTPILPKLLYSAVLALFFPALAPAMSYAGPVLPRTACDVPSAMQQLPRLPRVAARLGEAGPLRILAIGSSSTQGVGATSPASSYPARLEVELAPLLGHGDIKVENAGVGGETAGQTLRRLGRISAQRRFDLVIWQVGTNDAVRGGSEDAFLVHLRQGIEAVKVSGADLVLMDQQYLDSIADPVRYRRFVSAVAAQARAQGVPLFSRFAAMRIWAAAGQGGLDALLASDRFHLNDRGYACLARDLAASIAAPIAGKLAFTRVRAL
jgi:lysophospholipase L1-like esterase